MLDFLVRVLHFPVESYKRDRWLLPNKISYVRIALFWLPATLLVIGPDSELARIVALFVFALVAVTDSLDGYIARSRNQTSELGRWLDPVADKLLVIAAFAALLVIYLGDPAAGGLYWLFWLSLAREITAVPAIFWVQQRIMSPTWLGKLKMVLQCVAVGLWIPILTIPWMLATRDWVTYITIFVVVVSWLEYLWKFVFHGRLSAR